MILAAGAPVLRLVESGVLEAWIGVPVDTAARLAEGSTRTLRIGGRDIEATVTARMPQLEETTRTVRVVLALDAADAADLVPGQIARLAVRRTVVAEGFHVPTSALARGERGLWSLYTVTDSTVRRAVVEVLHTDGERTFIRGALTPGQVAIASGIHRVAPGQVVSEF